MRREVSYYIREKKRTASTELAHVLKKCIGQIDRPWKEIIILCIGSDRITGDSLGSSDRSAAFQTSLEKYPYLRNIGYAGSCAESRIRTCRHQKKTSICADSRSGCLSRLSKTYRVYHRRYRPIHPGSGVHKSLPAVGDLHITGILNASGSFEHFLLQTTRLSFVVQMADTITDGILHTFSPVYERRGLLPDGWFHREERRDLCWAKEESRLAALSIETSSGSIS